MRLPCGDCGASFRSLYQNSQQQRALRAQNFINHRTGRNMHKYVGSSTCREWQRQKKSMSTGWMSTRDHIWLLALSSHAAGQCGGLHDLQNGVISIIVPVGDELTCLNAGCKVFHYPEGIAYSLTTWYLPVISYTYQCYHLASRASPHLLFLRSRVS
jgi:hypothetical protein